MGTLINDIVEEVKADLVSTQLMKEFLELRLHLNNANVLTNNENEINENDILKMKTIFQINRLNNLIEQRQNDFEETIGRYFEEIKNENKNEVSGSVYDSK